MTTANIGTLTAGTLEPYALAGAFIDELARLGHDGEAVKGWRFDLERICCMGIEALNDDLVEALNDEAPIYCYFGAHPDDGADFGFWPDWDRIQDDTKMGVLACELANGAKVNFTPEGEVPIDSEGLVEYNDHGNVTMYQRQENEHGQWIMTEVWSIV